jgi:predicted RNA binding protein YcfA (HicA-like mRNA interferase family)
MQSWIAQGRSVGKDSRAIIRELEADGSRPAGVTGSHHHFKHPIKQGKVTVPHPRKGLAPEVGQIDLSPGRAERMALKR